MSIIIPTLARASLRASLESALRSCSGAPSEVLLVDDRDPPLRRDAPLEDVLVGLQSGGVPIRVLFGAARGAAAARNVALDEARGDWVAFLDDDDLMLPDHVPTLLRHAGKTGADLVHSGVLIRLPGGEERLGFGWAADTPVLQMANVIPTSAALIRRRGLVVRFDTRLPTLEDWALWLELSTGGRTAYTGTATCVYRHGPQAVGPPEDALRKVRSGLVAVSIHYERLCARHPSGRRDVLAGREFMRRKYEAWLRDLGHGILPAVDHYETALAELLGPPSASGTARPM